MKLTDQQIKGYVDADGGICPICGADNLDCGSCEYTATGRNWEILCLNCGYRWRDILKLTNIESIDQ